MIVRSPRKTNFTIISNIGMEDTRLTLKAKGLLAYLLTKPDNWQVNDRHLSTIGPDGRSAIQSALKELEELGYLKREKYQDEKGRWLWRSVLYDEPWTENPATDNQHEPSVKLSKKRGSSVAGKSVDGKSSHIISTDGISTEKKEEEKNISSDKPQLPEKTGAKKERPRDLMFDRLAWIVGVDPQVCNEKKRGELNQTLGILKKADYNADDITAFWEYWKNDWRYQKDKRKPTIQEVRNEIGKIRKQQTNPIPDKNDPAKIGPNDMIFNHMTGKLEPLPDYMRPKPSKKDTL